MLEQALERIDELEQQQSAKQEVAPAAAPVTEQVVANTERLEKLSWAERIRLKGDFRYRYQNDDVDGIDDRNRQRIRARAAIEADVADNIEVGLGIASGSNDPVSTNQTLGGGASTKDLNLDLAYFKWNAAVGANIYGGKFKRPLKVVAKSGLQFDGDWRPEGAAVTYDEGMFFANAVCSWLESDNKSGS